MTDSLDITPQALVQIADQIVTDLNPDKGIVVFLWDEGPNYQIAIPISGLSKSEAIALLDHAKFQLQLSLSGIGRPPDEDQKEPAFN